MCDAWSLIWALATTAAVAGGVGLLLSTGRFQDRIQTSHAATWQWLGTWKFRAIDSEPAEAALPEFIWTGMYKQLDDIVLNELATRIKITTVLAVASIGVLVFVSWRSPLSTVLACVYIG